MKTISRFISEPSPCSYLADRDAITEYEAVQGMTRKELHERIQQGWRRQGYMLFRPVCQTCHACQPIRILVQEFQPDRSQRRVIKANHDIVLKIGKPKLSVDRIELYVRHHAHHAEQKGWKKTNVMHAANQIGYFMTAPSDIEEWSYYLDDKLIAISYIDVLEQSYSGVYFYHHPNYRQRSLGTWCILSLIQRARELGFPYVYLGYYVAGCRSMEYKGRFSPSEIRHTDGRWMPFNDPSLAVEAQTPNILPPQAC
jgi:leucyl-tRNA---protein transferase